MIRLRPVLIANGIGEEVQRPLTSVVMGGITSSTILTLVVLPIMYARFEKHMQGKVAH